MADLVEFAGREDPLHPSNWPSLIKTITALITAFSLLTASGHVTVLGLVTDGIVEYYNAPGYDSGLVTLMPLVGIAVGSLIWGPSAEIYGRKRPLVLAMAGLTIFSFAAGQSTNIKVAILLRTLGGVFAACPLALTTEIFQDLYGGKRRGMLTHAIYFVATLGGQLVFASAGTWFVLNQSSQGVKWAQFGIGIMGVVAVLLNACLKETHPPVILATTLRVRRYQTRNWAAHTLRDENEPRVKVYQLIEQHVSRPFLMLSDPVIFLLNFYTALTNGLWFTLLALYSIAFQVYHPLKLGLSGLPYLFIVLGTYVGTGMVVLMKRKVFIQNGRRIPERLLLFVFPGVLAFAVGSFWLGGTGFTESTHLVLPLFSGVPTGIGFLSIMLPCSIYMDEACPAEVLRVNTILRSLAGAGLPFLLPPMEKMMGACQFTMLLGGIVGITGLLPTILYFCGERLRRRSKYTELQDAGRSPDEETGTGLESYSGSPGTRRLEERESETTGAETVHPDTTGLRRVHE